MKITRIVVIIAVLALGFGAAYALSTTISGGQLYTFVMPDGNNSTLTFTPSTNVTVTFNSGLGCYAAYSKHLNGDREFAAACDSVQIWWKQASAGTAMTEVPGSTGYGGGAMGGFNSL
jgi:hypothetical protein